LNNKKVYFKNASLKTCFTYDFQHIFTSLSTEFVDNPKAQFSVDKLKKTI